ncbi:MAG: HlyD family secretion protein [gamma proteobacterium symbiont of Bathyaustriella thionipta]|nr:HlyD family secretion protein [gamma proteobacterium symbiont of Bathyaustriella thionipta]
MTTGTETTDTASANKRVRSGTIIVLLIILLLLAWYLVSDRLTPFTSQARVHALVIPVTAEVSATVISVDVGNNQKVKAGQLLFKLDPRQYQLAVEKAQADLQAARQSMGASLASVDAAEASLVSAEANLQRVTKDAIRLKRIQNEDPGAISVRRIESAEASLIEAQGRVDSGKAKVEKAKQDLGQADERNSRILQAQSALGQAQLDLQKTIVKAPANGLVTDVRLDRGNYAKAGSPQMTFIAIDDIWLQAEFTENNLGHVKAGNPVKIVFDAYPGEVFSGVVREIGYGVDLNTPPLGSLPTIDNNRNWLRDAQRYPLLVDFDLPMQQGATQLRVGSQANVVILTGDNGLFNALAGILIWFNSMLTYAY